MIIDFGTPAIFTDVWTWPVDAFPTAPASNPAPLGEVVAVEGADGTTSDGIVGTFDQTE